MNVKSKLIIVMVFLTNQLVSFAQNDKNWSMGVGYSRFGNIENTIDGVPYKNFNSISLPNLLTFEKVLYNKFSFKLSGSFNEFEPNATNSRSENTALNDKFVALDADLKYNLSEGLGKNDWFNPYIIAGLGYSKFGDLGDAKISGGVGLNVWFSKIAGLQLNSVYNKNFQLVKSEYFTHSLGLVFNLGVVNENKNKFAKKENLKKDIPEKTVVKIDENKKIKNEDKVLKEKINKEKKENKKIKNEELPKVVKVEDSDNRSIKKSENVEEIIPNNNKKTTDKDKITEFNKEDFKKDKNTEIEPIKEVTETAKTVIPTNKEVKEEQSENIVATESLSDSDNDGVPDSMDKCPTIAGDKNYFGCPIKKENVVTNQDIKSEENNEEVKETVNNSKGASILKVSTVYFEMDGSDINDAEKSKIHMIIYILDKNPKSKILIEGHTAKDGDMDYSKKLAENRAKSVRQYLINKGVNPSRIEMKFYGNTMPVTSDTSETGKALNRRAKIILYNL